MFKTLKTIAAELKRANDLKQRDIEKCESFKNLEKPMHFH